MCCQTACGAIVSIGGKKRAMGAEPAGAPVQQRQSLPHGIAGSRHAETMQAFGDVLVDPMMDRLLQPEILKNVRQEFDKHRHMLDVLNGLLMAFRGNGL